MTRQARQAKPTVLLLAALLLALLVSTARAAEVQQASAPGYSCDPVTCQPSNNCCCASRAAPGRLPPSELPQFVLVTHDDAVDKAAFSAVRSITDAHANHNGCRLPVTWFVMKGQQKATDPQLVSQLYQEGHEIATHTWHHPRLTPDWRGDLTTELVQVRTWISIHTSIPVADIAGFRSPYLIHRPDIRKALYQAGFLYDSSILEPVPSPTSPSPAQRLWPYTMGNGIPQDCNFTQPEGTCSPEERYEGFWEVPMWTLTRPGVGEGGESGGSGGSGAFVSDYDGLSVDALFDLLVHNFEQAYQGNRAPLGLHLHSPWLTQARTEALSRFIAYTLERPEVYYITMQQLISWMKGPLPVSALNAALKCRPGGTQLATSPPMAPPAPPAPDVAQQPSGLRVTLALAGTTEAAFRSELAPRFTTVLAGALGVPPVSVALLSPAATAALQRLHAKAHGAPGLGGGAHRRLEVVAFVTGGDPASLLSAAQAAHESGALVAALTPLGLTLAGEPQLEMVESGQAGAADTTVEAASSVKKDGIPGSSVAPNDTPASDEGAADGREFPTAAVVGTTAGGLAALTCGLLCALLWRRALRRAQEQEVPATTADSAGSSTGSRDGAGGTALASAASAPAPTVAVLAGAGSARRGSGLSTAFSAGATRSGLSPRKHPRPLQHPRLQRVVDAELTVVVKGGSAPTTPTRRHKLPPAL